MTTYVPQRDATSEDAVSTVSTFLKSRRDEAVAQLTEWVRIPSIAAQPEEAINLERSANWLAGELRRVGLTTELIRAGSSIAVLAEWLVDEALPTVLVYSHHDVRHAKPEEWAQTAPFEPVCRDGRLYGRGASDAKGQVMAHLWGLRAHLETRNGGGPAVNLKFIVEGEEEMGSPHFADLLAEYQERLRCDVIVFSDTLQWKDGNPAVVTSMRGMISATLEVLGPERDVHSGAASGTAPNPLKVLTEVLAGLHDTNDHIMLPNFYDRVEKLTSEREQELADLDFDADRWVQRTETRHIVGEQGFTPEERLWVRPSLEILSLLAGDPEGIARAVIPAKATADLSIRTVPGQKVADVADQLRSYFATKMPQTVTYKLSVDEATGQEPYVTPPGPALEALTRAMAQGHGTETAGRMGNAGGGPAELLSRVLHAPVLFVGTGLPEDHWHSSDESIDVDVLLQGAASIAHLWTELAATFPITNTDEEETGR